MYNKLRAQIPIGLLLLTALSFWSGCSPLSVSDLPHVTKSNTAHTPVIGNPAAPIHVIVFSDFQCTFCKHSVVTTRKLLERYPDQVRIEFRHMPLRGHPQSVAAAKAAIAAGEQGKFWEMHDSLFQNQDRLSGGLYPNLAESLGLDIDIFRMQQSDPLYNAIIKRDKALARRMGVRGTPAYFIGGVPVHGARNFSEYSRVVDQQLRLQQTSIKHFGN